MITKLLRWSTPLRHLDPLLSKVRQDVEIAQQKAFLIFPGPLARVLIFPPPNCWPSKAIRPERWPFLICSTPILPLKSEYPVLPLLPSFGFFFELPNGSTDFLIGRMVTFLNYDLAKPIDSPSPKDSSASLVCNRPLIIPWLFATPLLIMRGEREIDPVPFRSMASTGEFPHYSGGSEG